MNMKLNRMKVLGCHVCQGKQVQSSGLIRLPRQAKSRVQVLPIRRHGKQAGFSLIEILLVVGIIAFLATMVATNVIGQGETTKVRNAGTGVRMIAAKASSYYLDTGSSPSKLDDLISKPGNAQNWKGPYITETQSKDPWGNPYILKSPGEHSEMDVVSLGSDGQVGGADRAADIGNWQ
jgi:general secretion pathway protein G